MFTRKNNNEWTNKSKLNKYLNSMLTISIWSWWLCKFIDLLMCQKQRAVWLDIFVTTTYSKHADKYPNLWTVDPLYFQFIFITITFQVMALSYLIKVPFKTMSIFNWIYLWKQHGVALNMPTVAQIYLTIDPLYCQFNFIITFQVMMALSFSYLIIVSWNFKNY